MDEKTSNNHVAQLLKQLEELKKKKARKERKLMKLKRSSFKDSSKERCSDSSPITPGCKHDSRLLNSAIKDKSYTFQNHIESENQPCNVSNKSEVFQKFAYPKGSEREKIEENYDCKTPAVILSDVPKFENSIRKCATQINETSESVSCQKEATVHTDIENGAESTKIASTNQVVCDREVTSCNELPLVNSSTLCRSKSPDLMDDSLNSNMSCFMLVDGNEQKYFFENDCNNICEPIENKYSKQTTAEQINSDLKISPPFSFNPSSNESQQANGVFNFPKFSTPTDLNIYQSGDAKNMLDNLQDKCESQKTSINVINPLDNIRDDNSCVYDIHSVENIPKENFAENKQNLQLKCILGSGLSSMLDACYGSPVKEHIPKSKKIFDSDIDEKHSYFQDSTNVSKKRKFLTDYNGSCLEENLKKPDSSASLSVPNCDEVNKYEKMVPYQESSITSKNNSQCNLDNEMIENNYQAVDELDFDNDILNSDPFTDSQNVDSSKSSSYKVSSQVTKAVDGLIAKVCKDISNQNSLSEFSRTELKRNDNENITFNSEVMVIPETEGLGLYFSKDTEDFLETSALSQSFRHFETNNLLNTSSQSKLASPIVNNIVSALKLSKGHSGTACKNETESNQSGNLTKEEYPRSPKQESLKEKKISCSASHDDAGMDTLFLEDDTQELGKLVQVPYMTAENVQDNSIIDSCQKKGESTLKFTCSLHGAFNEPVLDAEIVLFNDVKYAFLQHRTQIHVWRQEKAQWVKIFHHSIEDA